MDGGHWSAVLLYVRIFRNLFIYLPSGSENASPSDGKGKKQGRHGIVQNNSFRNLFDTCVLQCLYHKKYRRYEKNKHRFEICITF